MVGKMVGKSVSMSVSKCVTVRSAKIDEQVLMPDLPDDAVERAGGRTHNQALTLGFCTFNLLECPIGGCA